MKLFLDQVDYTTTLGGIRVDLQKLIVAAGHECIVKNFNELTHDDLMTLDYFIAQRQINLQNYLTLCRALPYFRDSTSNISSTNEFTRQAEIHMLDKGYAHQKIEELGLNFLNTKSIRSRDDIVNFADEVVVLKPRASMQSRSDLDFAYLVMSKDELLTRVDEVGLNLVANGDYVIQEAVTNDHPIMWIGGYVNPQGDILIDAALKQKFVVDDEYFEDRTRNPDRHLMYIEENPLDELDRYYLEAIEQIKVVLTHFQTKSTPFCIQAIVDDDGQVQLLDFNFGFGKIYALRVRVNTPEYIIDRIKYTYGGADTIPPNTTFIKNIIVNTPNGVTEEIKSYMAQHCIFLSAGLVEKDVTIETNAGLVTFYHRNKTDFVVLGSSKDETNSIIENFRTFLSTL